WTDRHVERLLTVAVVVADEKTAAAVLVDEPTLERARDTGAELLARLRQLLARRQHPTSHHGGRAQRGDRFHADSVPCDDAGPGGAFRRELFVFVVIQIDNIDPGVCHLVNRAITVAYPLIG